MKILFVSLGCDKNLVDSEKMLGMLQEKGYTFTDDEAEADVVVVNTCCFIGDAKEESINTLLQMGELKDSGQVKALIAAGCLAQRYREEIQKEIPQARTPQASNTRANTLQPYAAARIPDRTPAAPRHKGRFVTHFPL